MNTTELQAKFYRRGSRTSRKIGFLRAMRNKYNPQITQISTDFFKLKAHKQKRERPFYFSIWKLTEVNFEIHSGMLGRLIKIRS